MPSLWDRLKGGAEAAFFPFVGHYDDIQEKKERLNNPEAGPAGLGSMDQIRQAALANLGVRRPVQQLNTLDAADARRGITRNAAQLQLEQAASREQQLAQQQRLAAIAAGGQMGPGQLAAQQAADRGRAAQLSMASAATGPNAGLARRAAARNIGNMAQVSAGQRALAALQDQQSAEASLGGALSGMRQADLASRAAQMNALGQLRQQDIGLAQADVANALRGQQLDDQLALGSLRALTEAEKADAAQAQQSIDSKNQFLGGVLGAAGGAVGAMLSDRRAKKNVESAGEGLDELLDKLRPYSYDYKDESHGKGRFTGVMAQDLESSKVGREMVQQLPDGKKVVDANKALQAALAGLARLNERLGAKGI